MKTPRSPACPLRGREALELPIPTSQSEVADCPCCERRSRDRSRPVFRRGESKSVRGCRRRRSNPSENHLPGGSPTGAPRCSLRPPSVWRRDQRTASARAVRVRRMRTIGGELPSISSSNLRVGPGPRIGSSASTSWAAADMTSVIARMLTRRTAHASRRSHASRASSAACSASGRSPLMVRCVLWLGLGERRRPGNLASPRSPSSLPSPLPYNGAYGNLPSARGCSSLSPLSAAS